MNHGDLVYVQHILDSIKDIETSVRNLSKEKFQESKDIKDACIRRLEIIGEAVKNVSREIKDKYSLVEWKKIAGARDLMIHSYFKIDLDVVWNIISKDLPRLKKQLTEIKNNLKNN